VTDDRFHTPGEATDRTAHAPLSVETNLTLSVDGTPVELRSTGDRLFVDVPTLATAVKLLRTQSVVRERLTETLRVSDLTVEIRVRGATVAVAGARARPGVLSREFGTDPVELRLGGVTVAGGRSVLTAIRTVARLLPS
jgi:hypothetical protein